jgi:hypothetical protein
VASYGEFKPPKSYSGLRQAGDFAGPKEKRGDPKMSNRENEAGKSAVSLVPLILAAITICVIAILLMPASATSETSEANAVTYAAAGDAGYLPAQIVNQGRESEPEVKQYY